MIQLINVFCVFFRHNDSSNIWIQKAVDSIISDPIKRRAQYMFRTSEELLSSASIWREHFLPDSQQGVEHTTKFQYQFITWKLIDLIDHCNDKKLKLNVF